MPRTPGCTRCALHAQCQTVCVWGHGPLDARIVLVGEAPGGEEDKGGRPFVGQAGRKLDDLLAAAGLRRDEVYITNTVRCRPPGNRTPTKVERDACLLYLAEELDAIRPAVVVALGATALEALTGLTGVTKARGRVLSPQKRLRLDVPIIGTFHPASLLYGGNREENAGHIVSDLKLAAKIARGPVAQNEVVAVPPGGDYGPAISALERLLGAEFIAVDLEWRKHPTKDNYMLWPWNPLAEVYSVAVSGRVNGQVVSVAVSLPWEDEVVESLFRRLLRDKPVVAHNAMADMFWLMSLHMVVNLRADTMVIGHLLDETQTVSLEVLAPRYAPDDVDAGWKGHLYEYHPSSDEAWLDLLIYNATDTYATVCLFEGERRALDRLPHKRALVRVHDELFLSSLPLLLLAAWRGVPIDGPRLTRELEAAHARYTAAAEEFADYAGLTPPQARKLAGSPQQVREYVSQAIGLTLDSTNKDILSLLDQYPQVRMILRCRAEQKLIGTYLEPWHDLLRVQGDGRLHTVYRPTGTRTGRMSAEIEDGGSLQVAPRNDPRLNFREMIAAPPGWKIIAADYSQIELRVGAWIANEQTMLRLVHQGEDLHYVTAAFMIANSESLVRISEFWERKDHWIAQVTKNQRQNAKAVNFGFLYGMEVEKFLLYVRTNYGIRLSYQQAYEMRQSYMRLYSGLQAWHDDARARAMRGEETVTPFGRRRRYTAETANAAINTPVQSTASDLTLLAMIQANRAIRGAGITAYTIGFVHDSILVEARDEDVEGVSSILVERMVNVDTSAFGFTVPVPLAAEVKVGQTWE